MIACSGKNIGKNFGGDSVLEQVTFEINEKERIGIVGRNGSGKTTLLNILAGDENLDAGEIHWKKGTNVGYLAQLPVFPMEWKSIDVLKSAFSELILLEKEMKDLERKISEEKNERKLTKLVHLYGEKQEKFALDKGYEMEANIERVAHGLNIQSLLTKSFHALSGGERTKVCLGVILLKNPDLLLLDEPTNHLDIRAVEWLGRFLKDFEGTVVLISHDRYFLDEVVNKIFDLEDGELNVYHSNFSSYVKEKEKRLLNEFHQYEEQQKKIKKMREAIKRLRLWANQANPPNEGLHKRARNMERALERMEKLDRPVLNRKKMLMDLQATDRSGTDTIVLEGVSKSFGKKILFQEMDMHIRYKDRVVLLGDNGTGKSTLLKMILGEETADNGKIKIGSQVKVGYLAQHVYSAREEKKTIMEAFREEVPVSEADARHILARFLFYGYAVFKKLGQLSGGERMRLRLAQFMYQKINLLILDEPTNHLDIDSREVLEEALEEFQGTILAVSHDRFFINKLFQQVYWIEDKRLYFFEGNYDRVKVKLNEMIAKEDAKVTLPEKKSVPADWKKVENVSQLSKPSILDTETELEAIEAHITELEQQLLGEAEVEMLQELYQEKEKFEEKREHLYMVLEQLIEE